ncbi:hypothetical protein C8035_v012330 [Colletotrichum spinosum]|uniref:SnoaL-like domain-containing protein n=1 Tax=Colletotrichum spinosum TaxID=1347390 RepID=A0A4R8Q4W9_9PEZI|nr:hypothetical protein C8035_v012330 [Colletotrichum spinosum]
MASTSSSSSNLRERIEATARAFLSAFEEVSVQDDVSIINRDVTADCTRHLLPASVPEAFGLPAGFFFDNATYFEAVSKDNKVLKFKNNILSNLVIDTDARRASFTSDAEVHPVSGEAWYPVEMAWFLYFDEDGSKITRVVEFGDKDGLLRMASESA